MNVKNGRQAPDDGRQAEKWVFADMNRRHRGDDGRLVMTAEAAMRWAWRDELPKSPSVPAGPNAFESAWHKTSEYGEYLSLVDRFGVNAWGCVPDFSSERWPHTDAEAIAREVFALDDLAIELPSDWNPAPELDGFDGLGAKAISDALRKVMIDDGRGGRRLSVKPSDLIIRRAILGDHAERCRLDGVVVLTESYPDGRPIWFRRMPQDIETGTDANGKPVYETQMVEIAGVKRNGHPYPGSYQKRFIDPDPVWAIVARAEHEIWQSALCLVQEALAGLLTSIDMRPTNVAARPWEQPERCHAPRTHEAHRPAGWQRWFIPAQSYAWGA